MFRAPVFDQARSASRKPALHSDLAPESVVRFRKAVWRRMPYWPRRPIPTSRSRPCTIWSHGSQPRTGQPGGARKSGVLRRPARHAIDLSDRSTAMPGAARGVRAAQRVTARRGPAPPQGHSSASRCRARSHRAFPSAHRRALSDSSGAPSDSEQSRADRAQMRVTSSPASEQSGADKASALPSSDSARARACSASRASRPSRSLVIELGGSTSCCSADAEGVVGGSFRSAGDSVVVGGSGRSVQPASTARTNHSGASRLITRAIIAGATERGAPFVTCPPQRAGDGAPRPGGATRRGR